MLVQFVELWDCNYELTHSGCATSKQLLCLCFYLQRMAEMMAKGAFFFMICVFFFFLSMCLFILLILFESSSPLFVFFWLIGLASSDEAGGCLWNTKKKHAIWYLRQVVGFKKTKEKKPQHLWRPDSIGAEGFVCAFACVFVLINEYYSESRVCRGFRGHVAPPSSFTLHSSNSAWCI